jgi:hypothetical protein
MPWSVISDASEQGPPFRVCGGEPPRTPPGAAAHDQRERQGLPVPAHRSPFPLSRSVGTSSPALLEAAGPDTGPLLGRASHVEQISLCAR